MLYYFESMVPEQRHDALSEVVGDETFSLHSLLKVFRKWLGIILLVIVVVTGVVVSNSLLQTPTYEASTKLLVGQQRGISASPQDSLALQNLTATMSEAVVSRRVAEEVIQRLDLETSPEAFLANLSAEQVPDTQFIRVSYRATDPRSAQQITNATGEVFSEQVSEISPEASAITVTVWEQAIEPTSPASPQPMRAGVIALVLGCMLGVGLAFVLEYFDDRWESPEEAEIVTGVPTFGVIPEFEASKAARQKKKQADTE